MTVFEEPIVSPGVRPRLDVTKRPGGITVAVPHVPEGLTQDDLVRLQKRLLDGFLADQRRPATVAWYYSPSAYAFSSHLAPNLRVYDCMDELTGFRGAPAGLRELERRLMAKSDLVFTGGHSLWQAKRGLHHSVHAFPSSIDARHFAKARRDESSDRAGLAEPADQAAIPHPRMGFFGVIDERMDVDLVRETAKLRPDWQFVMIGPVVKIDEADLPRAPNIHWLGSKTYADLPSYLAGWDAGFMPFARNEATRFISPTKTPEFLAAGLPVVSTAIADVVRPYGEKRLVEIADTAAATVTALERAMASVTPEWRGRVDRHLSTTSWDQTWSTMHRLMLARLERRRAPVPRALAVLEAEGVARV